MDRKISGIHKTHFLFQRTEQSLCFFIAQQTSTNSKIDVNARKICCHAKNLNI